MGTRTYLIGLVAGALLGVAAPPAQAAFGVADNCQNPVNSTCWVAGIYNRDYTGMNDRDFVGAPAQEAGGHPFVGVTDFQVNQTSSGAPDGEVKDIRVDVPAGLISDPQAVPQCSDSGLSTGTCPNNTQLGIVELEASLSGVTVYVGASVYNAAVEAGHCAGYVSDYAFNTATGRIDVCGGIRSTSDDGLYFTIAAPQNPALIRSTLIFWGVPGDTGHDPQRGWSCLSALVNTCTPPASAPGTPQGTPFLSNPSGCVAAGQVTTLTLDSYEGDWAHTTSTTPVAAIGCADVPFTPSLTVTPQTTASDTPTGVNVDLHVPQNEEPAGVASATVKDASVTLPPGMTLDPSAANGLAACTPAEFGHGSDAPPTCPTASQLGTAEIDTPLLATPLTGSVYLGCDGSSAATPCPATGGLAYLYVYVTGRGVTQKLIGTVTADRQSGQLTTTFLDQPQVPFSDFKLDLHGGPTAALANPLACGQATTTGLLTPYSGNPSAAATSSFTIDSNGAGAACARPTSFAPGLTVVPATVQAGVFDSPLTFEITRPQQQQYLGRISTTLPRGLIGLISRVPLCPDAQAATGACPAASRVGTTTVLAGSGSQPITQAGNVYLTGPYAGAPYGLSIAVSAVAGPFDLGAVVVRAAIEVDKASAQITIVTDALPQVVGGIPLRMRSVVVTLDRPGFTLNPTNCDPAAVDATLTSTQSVFASAASQFQAAGCGALAFAPGLRISLTGHGQTTSGKHPTLLATVTSALGQANVRATSVTLPLSLALDPNNSAHVCSVAASEVDTCPANTIVGSATVQTPVLSAPLTGPAYLVQGIRTGLQGQQIHTLPALLITLRGPVAIDLRAQTSVDSLGRLVTTFPAVPDAPISRFTLQITGGQRGILVVTGRANLCRRAQVAHAALAGQNGATDALALTIGTPCPNRASVSGLTVAGHTVRLQVTTPAAGSVLAGGPGLRPSRRRVAQANTVSFVLHLTSRAAARLRRQGSLKLRVDVRYSREGGPARTILSRSVTIRR
jgi:hypothetical protein